MPNRTFNLLLATCLLSGAYVTFPVLAQSTSDNPMKTAFDKSVTKLSESSLLRIDM
jgi:hypothetical protein